MPKETAAPQEKESRRLGEAILALTSELSLPVVLQKVADLGRELVGATYCALGIVGEGGDLAQFITSGISQRARERIGALPKGRGLLGVVLREGKPLRVTDISQHPETVGFPSRHPRMTSFLGVPIVLKGRVLGNLYLTDKLGAKEFSQEDELLAGLFAAQAAVAIENGRLFGLEARKSNQLDVLNRIGQDLTRVGNLDALLQTVVPLVQERFHYPNVRLLWVNKQRRTMVLRVVAGAGEGRLPVGARYPWGQGISGWVATHGQAVLSKDLAGDPRNIVLPDFRARSALAVPVVARGETVAVLRADALEPNAFDASDVKTMQTVADQLAVAIENLRLHEQQARLAVLEERERIAMDLHDGVIQSVYGVGFSLENAIHDLEAGPSQAKEQIEGSIQGLNRVIRDIRSYIADLRPRELQGRKFDDALESLVRDVEERTGASVAFKMGASVMPSLTERHVVNLWHILQEAFSNVEKYAQARNVLASLKNSKGILALEIADDGVGFDVARAEAGTGYGLANMKERTEKLGGVFTVESSPGHGTRLRVRIPVNVKQ
jgi:signal transduction histidine kinase